MSKNNITGDEIKTKLLEKDAKKAYDENYDRIFGKDKPLKAPVDANEKIDELAAKVFNDAFEKIKSTAQCPNYPEPCFCTGACKPSTLFKEQDCS